MEAHGQFRSYNKHENNKNHLVLSLFVRELEFIDSMENRKPNMIFLDGYICKEPVYRLSLIHIFNGYQFHKFEYETGKEIKMF